MNALLAVAVDAPSAAVLFTGFVRSVSPLICAAIEI
jgi:hypothetical protein